MRDPGKAMFKLLCYLGLTTIMWGNDGLARSHKPSVRRAPPSVALCIPGENDTRDIKCASYYVICWGDNFRAPDGTGRVFNPVTTDTGDFWDRLSKEEDKAILLKYMISRWAYNKPADTWSCKGYDGIAAFNRGRQHFADAGYLASPYHSLPIIPPSVLPQVKARQ